MKNFLQAGESVTVPAPYDVAAGAGVLVGSMFGIAQDDADSGDDVVLKLTGCFEINKTSAQAWTVGEAIYWDDNTGGDGEATSSSGASGENTLIGVAIAVAANPTATGNVRLNGTFA